jgi:ATP-binding cassette subfamily B protein
MFRRDGTARPGDRLLLGVIREGRRAIGALLLAAAANTAAVLAFPAMLAGAVDRQLLGTGSGRAVPLFAAVIVVLVGTEVAVQLLSVASTAAATRALRHRLFGHVLALGVPGRARFVPGDVISRLTSNTSGAAAVGPTLAGVLSSLLMSVGGVVALALIDPWLAVTFLVGLPVGLAIVRAFVARTAELSTRYLTALGTISGRLLDALAGARTIRVSGTLDQEVDRILRPAPELLAAGRGLWLVYGRASWQGGLFGAVVQLAVLTVAGTGVAAGRVTPGELLASIGYVGLALGLMGQSGLLASLARSRTAARRLAEILAEPAPEPGTAELPPGPGELILREITVRAGDRLVLDRVSLRVPAGRSVAIVGGSAAGKSTLAAVAGRLTVPDAGRVLLDGVPLDTVDPSALRREIGYAFERPALLGTTVADAIGYGSIPRSAIEPAARAAGIDTAVRRLPAGYDTPLAQAPMSGGEAQRLGLARALARGGRLLILDDATSSLDTVTELQVSRALIGTLTGRTCLVVAHRPSTLARCDLVAWLEDGRIQAVGPHRVLWNDPRYRALFQAIAAEPACVPV